MKTNISVLVFIAVLALGALRFDIPSRWFGTRDNIANVQGDFNAIGAALRTYKLIEKSIESDFISISSALETYRKTTGDYPTTNQGLMALVTRLETLPEESDWESIATRVPTDPWKNEYRYRRLPDSSPRPFELRCVGPDGIEGNEDDRVSE